MDFLNTNMHQLQAELEDLHQQLENAREAAKELRLYAESPKFNGEAFIIGGATYIQKNDVINRTWDILDQIKIE